MLKTAFKVSAVSLALSGGILTAHAGGLERSSQDFDILFEQGNIVEGGATFVVPQRKMKNISGSMVGAATGGINPTTGKPYETSVNEAKSYWVPKLSARFQLTDDLACAAQYREPWGIETDVGTSTVLMYGSIKQKINSKDYGVNCSYRFAAGEKGYFRLLGGVSYQEISGVQTRLLPANTPLPGQQFREGRLDVGDHSFGWRLGAAYEIPEYAMRASLVYQSTVKYTLDGTVTNLLPMVIPVSAKATLPESVELKVQSGIAPNWLAFGSVKWVNWSRVTSIDFMNTAPALTPYFASRNGKVTSLDLYYQDGWTISGGVGHKLNDQWSVAGSVTWDRATTTGLTSQTDVWLFGLGTVYNPQPNFEIRVAGAAGLLTKGIKDDRIIAGVPNLTGSRAEFKNDFVGGLTVAGKIKF